MMTYDSEFFIFSTEDVLDRLGLLNGQTCTEPREAYTEPKGQFGRTGAVPVFSI